VPLPLENFQYKNNRVGNSSPNPEIKITELISGQTQFFFGGNSSTNPIGILPKVIVTSDSWEH
jgi:hypothetical protein